MDKHNEPGHMEVLLAACHGARCMIEKWEEELQATMGRTARRYVRRAPYNPPRRRGRPKSKGVRQAGRDAAVATRREKGKAAAKQHTEAYGAIGEVA